MAYLRYEWRYIPGNRLCHTFGALLDGADCEILANNRYASMPFDNIKTRMQSTHSQYKGMVDCARKTLRRDGVTAFWRGTSPRLVRLTVGINCAYR